jgi:hypothetical protein
MGAKIGPNVEINTISLRDFDLLHIDAGTVLSG